MHGVPCRRAASAIESKYRYGVLSQFFRRDFFSMIFLMLQLHSFFNLIFFFSSGPPESHQTASLSGYKMAFITQGQFFLTS